MSTTSLDEERKRKRLRKGTFSCWECKRRKVRCNYDSPDHSICNGCVARGTSCLSQEYPEDHKALPTEHNNSNAVVDRLSRIENVLEKLVNKIGSGSTEDGPVVGSEALESLGIDVLQSNRHENEPVYSLFDNAVFGRNRNDEEKPSASEVQTPVSTDNHVNSVSSKLRTTTRYLVSMLPKQEVVDAIVVAGNSWWLVKSCTKPVINQYHLGLESVHMLSERHPIIVARGLLYLVILLQQLPSTFDRHQLDAPCSQLMDKFHIAVSTRVLMDDELIGSVEGIECLLLQCIYHINGARPRSGWLSMRRSMAICQLLGIHRKKGRCARESEAMSAKYMEGLWSLIVGIDRYLAIIIGLPYGTSDIQCDLEDELTDGLEEEYQRKMSSISTEIIDWNCSAPEKNLARADELDKRIDELANTMPPEWWNTPAEPVKRDSTLGFGRTYGNSAVFDRLMSQVWHFQLKAFLHLPFVLRSEPQYEKSAAACLGACRELIRRYIFFRKSYYGSYVCQIVDFQAFTAATTLLLDILGPICSIEYQQQRDESWELVQDVTCAFEKLANTDNPNPDVVATSLVATQGLKVLKALQSNRDSGSDMKLVIPYFGTVTISRSHRPSSSTPSAPIPRPIPNNFHQSPEAPQQQQHQHQQQIFNITRVQDLPQQVYNQQFPIVSFANGSMPRPDPEQESLWCDWLLQDSNGHSFQNMFDPNLGTLW